MPLDDFQAAVIRTIAANRTPDSVCAGGSVLNLEALRLSKDLDIFHGAGTNVAAIAQADIASLRAAGYTVTLDGPNFEGLVSASVAAEGRGMTRLQWVQAGNWNFFRPVEDAVFGLRLHMADLAINKLLAAAGRKQVRDFVDLAMIHRHLLPLWHLAWAAPGKDESWTPQSLLERIAFHNGFRQADIDAEIEPAGSFSAAEIGQTIRAAIDEARAIFDRLPPQSVGHLFVDAAGRPLADAARIAEDGVQLLAATPGGTLPSNPAIDHALISGIVAAHRERRRQIFGIG